MLTFCYNNLGLPRLNFVAGQASSTFAQCVTLLSQKRHVSIFLSTAWFAENSAVSNEYWLTIPANNTSQIEPGILLCTPSKWIAIQLQQGRKGMYADESARDNRKPWQKKKLTTTFGSSRKSSITLKFWSLLKEKCCDAVLATLYQ